MKKSVSIFMFVIVFAAVWSVSQADSDAVLTPPVILKSNDILNKKLLQGENYTIKETIMNDGIINMYHLTTDYGQLDIESTACLMIRINELNAIVTMEALERSGIFKDSLIAGVKAPVEGAVELIKSPIETTKGFLAGTGKFLSNMGRSIVSSDPHQDNVFKVALGYDAAKRAYAYEFGIDPYSTYSPVMDRLGKIARAAVAGGFVPKATMAAIDHDVVTVMRITSATKNLKKLVRDNSPGDLHKLNKKKLEKLGIPESQSEIFLSNYSYNPQEKTLLVGALEQMNTVEGLNEFIAAADTSSENSDALLFRLIAQMMAGYHARVKPVEQIIRIDGTLHLKTNDNILVLTAPADFIFKTSKIISKLANLNNKIRSMADVSGKELWITGKIDKSILKHFEASGWKVIENSNSIFNKEE